MEAVQHVQPAGKLDRVDGPVGVAPIVLDDLQHACGPEARQWLGVQVLAARLRHVECVPEDILHIRGHRVEVSFG